MSSYSARSLGDDDLHAIVGGAFTSELGGGLRFCGQDRGDSGGPSKPAFNELAPVTDRSSSESHLYTGKFELRFAIVPLDRRVANSFWFLGPPVKL